MDKASTPAKAVGPLCISVGIGPQAANIAATPASIICVAKPTPRPASTSAIEAGATPMAWLAALPASSSIANIERFSLTATTIARVCRSLGKSTARKQPESSCSGLTSGRFRASTVRTKISE